MAIRLQCRICAAPQLLSILILIINCAAWGNARIAFGEQASPKLRFILRGHSDYISSIAFSPDGKTLASAGPQIKLWNLETGKETATFKTDKTSSVFLRYSPDGRHLISASGGGEVILWDVSTGKHTLLWRDDPGGATNAVISRDGKTLAVIRGLKDIDIWDFSSRKRLRSIEGPRINWGAVQFPSGISFSPDAKILAMAHGEGKIQLWDVRGKSQPKTIAAYEPVFAVDSVAFSPDGKTLAAGAAGNSENHYLDPCDATLWDVESGKQKGTFTGNKIGIADVAISPDGRLIATGGHDSTVRLWDIATQKPIATLKKHWLAVMCIAFSPDGRYLASGSGDRTVCVFELPAHEKKP